jgi:RNA polymerase sigma-70 factor, ECF subfamily
MENFLNRKGAIKINDLEISQLIPLAINGDQEAFFELYNCTIHTTLRVVKNLVYEKYQREDVVQEIYIELYKALPSYQQDKSFKPWFMSLIIRQTKSYVRKNWLLFRLKKKQLATYQHDIKKDFSDDVVDRLDNKELLQALHKLSFKLRNVITLRYIGELSQDEIAQILNLPVGTVSSRISYALKSLRKIMVDPKYDEKKVEKYGF